MNTGILAAIRLPFRGPHRWPNLGLAAVCLLIPYVGPLVLQGYGILVEKALIADPDATAPPFDFHFFVDHLKRGLPAFLVSLVVSCVFAILYVPVAIVLVFAIIILQKHILAFIILIVVAVLIELLLISLLMLILQPMMLKAAFEQSFTAAFNRAFVTGYLRRVGLLSLGYQLLLLLIWLLAIVFTLCIPFLGFFAALTILIFAQWHIQAELYRLYLARGGTPLRLDAPLFLSTPPHPGPVPPYYSRPT